MERLLELKELLVADLKGRNQGLLDVIADLEADLRNYDRRVARLANLLGMEHEEGDLAELDDIRLAVEALLKTKGHKEENNDGQRNDGSVAAVHGRCEGNAAAAGAL